MTELRYRKSQQILSWFPFFFAIILHTPTLIWMVLSCHTLVGSLSLFYMHRICLGSYASPPPCAASRFLVALFHVQRSCSIQCLPYVSKNTLIPIQNILDGFELFVCYFSLKCSYSGNTGLSISNFSSVSLSGKIEQLDSPSSVSDLSDFTRPDKHFIFFNLLKIRFLSL